MNIKHKLANEILILDGAMGSLIQKMDLTELDFRGKEFINHNYNLKGLYDILCLTQSNIIQKIHYDYLNAGADIIETNTFNANNFSLSDYGLDKYIYEINFKAAQIAKNSLDFHFSTCGKKCYIAGSIGPSNIKPQLDYSNIDIKRIRSAYELQIKGLIDGGCDILLIETIIDPLFAKAILMECEEQFVILKKRLPVMLSATISESGKLLSGDSLDTFYNIVKPFKPFSVGLNCGFGTESLMQAIKELSIISDCPIHIYPNAGLPNDEGDYIEMPRVMIELLNKFISEGIVNIIGGCCGTTPAHIKCIYNIINDYFPRKNKN